MIRKFNIPNNVGENLVCVEVMPTKKSDNYPVIILCHGFAYFKEEAGIFTEVAERMSGLGYAVYYFDFSGCGESEGDYSETTLTKLTNDLKSVYTEVTSFDYIDSGNVSLMGHSFGTSVIIASQLDNIRKIILSGSPCPPFDSLKNLFGENFNENGLSTRKASGGRTTTIQQQFWQDLKKYNLENLVKHYTCPILLIHGKQDTLVPIQNMNRLLASIPNPENPLVLEKSTHDLKPERKIAFEAVTNFFSK